MSQAGSAQSSGVNTQEARPGTSPLPPPGKAKHLVLVGAGEAHVRLLWALAKSPIANTRVTLVSFAASSISPSLLPLALARHCALADVERDVAAYARTAQAAWIQDRVLALDADQRAITLAGGETLGYDVVSIDAQGTAERDAIPGARELGLFVRPRETFASAWTAVDRLADERPLAVVVLGTHATCFELALAWRERLGEAAAVTWVCGPDGPLPDAHPRSRDAVKRMLDRRRVPALPGPCTAISATHVHLACGARLVCDVAVLATGTQPPAWLAASGLALSNQGFIATNERLQSSSHAEVFAVGDLAPPAAQAISRHEFLPTGRGLEANLRAFLTGQTLRPVRLLRRRAELLACSDRTALLLWGQVAWRSRMWWWLKRWQRQ